MLTNFKRNCMGTVSFDGKFDGMRKAQDFIVYPFHAGNQTESAMIQSDTRIGRIHLTTGQVTMSPPRAGGSYGVHMAFAKPAGVLPADELLLLKANIFSTADSMAGSNRHHVYTDNSGAANVFQVQA